MNAAGVVVTGVLPALRGAPVGGGGHCRQDGPDDTIIGGGGTGEHPLRSRSRTTALAAFVRATQRDVYRFLAHLCERGEVEDLTQETYLRALGALPGFAGHSSARTWLLSIARQVAADQVRRTVTRPRTIPVEDWDTVGAAGPARPRSGFDEGVLLRALVAGLEPDRRDAFVLTQVLGLGYAAAAEVCGCPTGTIRSRVARAGKTWSAN